MKIRYGIFLFVACVLIFASCATASTSSSKFDASQFPTWVDEEGVWRSTVPRAFKTGARNAPTDAQIQQIMNLVIKTPTSGGANDFFFLVVKDPAQQKDIVGDANAHDGTVTIMVFTDRVLEENPRNVPLSPDRGYVSAGFACGYINIAAISLGLGTHFYLTPTGYYGNRPWLPQYVSTNVKPPIEDVYLRGKGYQYFVDGDSVSTPTGNPDGAYFDPYGSLKFVLAITIGNIDETAETQVTTRKYPPNWAYAK